MPGIARLTQDYAGGMQIGRQAPTVWVNGTNIIVLGDIVVQHPPHPTNEMVQASSSVFANSIPVCREGDLAACGHPSTGSSDTFAGG